MFKSAINRATALFAAAAAVALTASPAFAAVGDNPLLDVLDGISLTGVALAVGAIMILVVGISMAFKGGDLGKRAVRKV